MFGCRRGMFGRSGESPTLCAAHTFVTAILSGALLAVRGEDFHECGSAVDGQMTSAVWARVESVDRTSSWRLTKKLYDVVCRRCSLCAW